MYRSHMNTCLVYDVLLVLGNGHWSSVLFFSFICSELLLTMATTAITNVTRWLMAQKVPKEARTAMTWRHPRPFGILSANNTNENKICRIS